jgi:tRNA threonylcarbamoyl adenosine modification protein YjeE
MTILSIRNLHTIKFTAKQFVSYLNNNPEKVYCFNGKMGAGKTTFIKAICEEMGVKETVNSPTFSIVTVSIKFRKLLTLERKNIYTAEITALSNGRKTLPLSYPTIP